MLMSQTRWLLLLLFISGSGISFAADEEQPTPTTAEQNQPPSAVLPPIKQFIPTEKIEADSTVSLPVDI